jgi:hypothetical protein
VANVASASSQNCAPHPRHPAQAQEQVSWTINTESNKNGLRAYAIQLFAAFFPSVATTCLVLFFFRDFELLSNGMNGGKKNITNNVKDLSVLNRKKFSNIDVRSN